MQQLQMSRQFPYLAVLIRVKYILDWDCAHTQYSRGLLICSPYYFTYNSPYHTYVPLNRNERLRTLLLIKCIYIVKKFVQDSKVSSTQWSLLQGEQSLLRVEQSLLRGVQSLRWEEQSLQLEEQCLYHSIPSMCRRGRSACTRSSPSCGPAGSGCGGIRRKQGSLNHHSSDAPGSAPSLR